MKYFVLLVTYLSLMPLSTQASEQQKQMILKACQQSQAQWSMDCGCVMKQYDAEIEMMAAQSGPSSNMQARNKAFMDMQYQKIMANPHMNKAKLERMCEIYLERDRVSENNRKASQAKIAAQEGITGIVQQDPALKEELKQLESNIPYDLPIVGYCRGRKIATSSAARADREKLMLRGHIAPGSAGSLDFQLGRKGGCLR